MRGILYPKLAFENIKKNSQSYVPYMLTCVLTVAMYYIMKSLSMNKGLVNLMGEAEVAYTLKLGTHVIEIFSFIFLFYTNSFLMKNRKKEFGLFNILGMEKKHIARIIAWENIYVTFISLAAGFSAGILLDKLMYVILLRILGAEIALGFYISEKAIIHTAVLFGILFFLIFLNALRMIHLSKPIELLKGGNTGEKEPKAKWLAALLGILCLGGGYYIAVTVKNPVTALTLFFGAVLLVIAGTYLTFTAGSIALLKILKANKRYYYRTNHFISISGMLYRMKQNAVGLANICILCTMVLVMISSTSSLMIGSEDILNKSYPMQINIYQILGDENDREKMVELVHSKADEADIEITAEKDCLYLEFAVVFDGKDSFAGGTDYSVGSIDNVYSLFFVTAEDYTKYTGEEANLSDDEVILWCSKESYEKDYLNIFGKTLKITGRTEKFPEDGMTNSYIYPTLGMVVKDISVINELDHEQKELYGDNSSNIEYVYGCDTNAGKEAQVNLNDAIYKGFSSDEFSGESVYYRCEARKQQRKSLYALYGGFFFLGLFLSLLFTMATVLIIYYKQISEGFDDKKRFEIMQKVGLSGQDVKRSIRSQVLTVFFLPLVTAGIHTAFAFPIIRKILSMFMLTNTRLYITCTIVSFLAFALVYGAVYFMTARVYYKIVRKQN